MGNGRNRKKCSNRNQRTLAINNGPKVLGIKQMDNGARHETFWRLAYGDCAREKKKLTVLCGYRPKGWPKKAAAADGSAKKKGLKSFANWAVITAEMHYVYEQTSKST